VEKRIIQAVRAATAAADVTGPEIVKMLIPAQIREVFTPLMGLMPALPAQCPKIV
jgi:hypothetical protein